MDESVESWFAREILAHEEALVRYLRRCWSQADDILDLLEGLLNELYANIAKHAAPHEWYAVTISFDRRHVIISASDVLKDEAVRLGLGSGLKRYRTVIESMSGTFDITDDSDNWNANITIPLSVTRR